ncbi:glycosyl transferase [Streptomyces sp. NPDC051018]|uniref:glycosyl transferase n=1 Tax=Streptomyces sp. NPDC051018 TaxID=3365639 RepID=UPI00379C0C3D
MTRRGGPAPVTEPGRPHLIYLAIGFPPAAKSCAYRMRETANQFIAQGWDVTVVTILEESWEREYGLDHTLSEAVDPRTSIVELPLVREDLETDIRRFTEKRALQPTQWALRERESHLKHFPEPVFGGWREELERAVVDIHRERPADLLVASCAPYVNLAAAWKLWETHKVPYAIDFRDGWSVDVIGGGEAFEHDSVSGRWESKVLGDAIGIWCVNDPIADFYRDRYPELAHRVHVVRNGFDKDSLPPVTSVPREDEGLVFGYLGSVNFKPVFLETVLNAWRAARERDPLVARSRFEIRGHIGAGASREANKHMDLIRAAEPDGVTFGGPVPKAEVAATYNSWDALVLMLVGGRFVTSGKVYEFMASGLPVLSAHESDHDASAMLEGHPLWTGAGGLDEEFLTEAFCTAARMAVEADDAQRRAARDHAARFARDAVMEPAVRQLIEARHDGERSGRADARAESVQA